MNYGDIISGGARRAATHHAPMKSVHGTQHHSLERLHRISHCTMLSPVFQEGTAKWALVFRTDCNSVRAVLGYTLNTAFYVSGKSFWGGVFGSPPRPFCARERAPHPPLHLWSGALPPILSSGGGRHLSPRPPPLGTCWKLELRKENAHHFFLEKWWAFFKVQNPPTHLGGRPWFLIRN